MKLVAVLSALLIATSFVGAASKSTFQEAVEQVLNDEELYFDKNIPEYDTVLTPMDFMNGAQLDAELALDEREWDSDALYNKDKFEGDIVNVNSSTIDAFVNGGVDPKAEGVQRNAIKNKLQMWPQGRIPYVLSSQYSSHSRSIIANSMEEYNKHTCIRWVPKENSDTDYVYIMPDRGCYSMVGRTGSRQVLSLGSGCIQKGIIIHEMMHAVGFFHEQSRTDRDDHITIYWNNIMNGMANQFEKYGQGVITALGTEYDYGSIMHYGETAFSKNGQPTMIPKKKGSQIGQRNGFSKVDIFKITTLYGCSGAKPLPQVSTQQPPTQPTTTSPPVTPSTSTAAPGPETCKNTRPDCPILAQQGWCHINAPWMKEHCPESCGFCGTITTKPESECEDLRVDCAQLVTARYCLTSENFMRKYCSKSCGFCTPKNGGGVISTETPITGNSITQTKPAPIYVTTTTYKPETYPTMPTHHTYPTMPPRTTYPTMPPRTTSTTTTTTTTTTRRPPVPEVCVDRKHFCGQWRSSGFCEGIFLSYMRKNCPKSCGYC
uniref:Metalloendopeptidase n=1 Tax=Rhabditophanes sp. KR3021 TaxID=114890 RepID=A0AC35TYP4_9BILA